MAASLIKTIRRIKSTLTWPVIHSYHDGTLDIISDPLTRTHAIRFPLDDHRDQVRPIEYLHELAHAALAEREAIFAVHEFVHPDIATLLPILSDPVRTTADWFVDDLVMQWAPTEQRAYIGEHVELMRRYLAAPIPDSSMILAAGHVFAQGEHYFHAHIPTTGEIDRMKHLFLTIPPRRRSRTAFARLFNSLLPPGISVDWDNDRAWRVTTALS